MNGLFTAAPQDANSHRTITSIALDGNVMTVREDDRAVRVPLSLDWTQDEGQSIAASATRLNDDRIAVDLVMLDTPHRLEVTLRPATRTFETHWPVLPIFGAGIDKRIASMRAP